MKVAILLYLVATAVAHRHDSGCGHAAPASPSRAAPAYAPPSAPMVHHANAPVMTTYSLNTYRSPAPAPVISAPPNYVLVTETPAHAPSGGPYAAPVPSYN